VVPNLAYNPAPSGLPSLLHTFFGLGFLDVHVDMSVDAAQNVTSSLSTHIGTVTNFPVRPGDTISATLCLQPDAAGTAAYFLANETTGRATTSRCRPASGPRTVRRADPAPALPGRQPADQPSSAHHGGRAATA